MGKRLDLTNLLVGATAAPTQVFDLLVTASAHAPYSLPPGRAVDATQLLWRAMLSQDVEIEYAAYPADDKTPATEKVLISRIDRDEETGRLKDERVLLQLTRTQSGTAVTSYMSPDPNDLSRINRAIDHQIVQRKAASRAKLS